MSYSKKLYTLILAAAVSSALCSCTDSSNSSDQKDNAVTSAVTTIPETEQQTPSETPEQAREKAELLLRSAQEIADKYSTAGATIRTSVFTSSDVTKGDAEKLNFCSMLPDELKETGMWAFKMEKFSIVSVVYSPGENSGIIIRLPEEYTGSTDDVSDLSSLL